MGHTGRASGRVGALADLIMPASVSLSFNWAQGNLCDFLVTLLDPELSPPKPPSPSFPSGSSTPAMKGSPGGGKLGPGTLAPDSTSKRCRRPGRARAPASPTLPHSHQVPLAPGWSFCWGKFSILSGFLSPVDPGNGKAQTSRTLHAITCGPGQPWLHSDPLCSLKSPLRPLTLLFHCCPHLMLPRTPSPDQPLRAPPPLSPASSLT